MRDYIRFFKWLYIIFASLLLLFGILTAGHAIIAGAAGYERTNTECTTTERVFDYGDVLTDKEEAKLRKLIAKREKQTGCDIVLVTLKESLKDYARAIDPNVGYAEFVKIYAEQFYEDNNFGYDMANGDGVILVDNWYREDDGRIYTWFCTTGKVKSAYSDVDIDHLLDNVYVYVEKDPYRAYETYVNDFYHDMLGINVVHVNVPRFVPWLIGIIATVIFIIINLAGKKGVKTTTANTYVNGMEPQFRVREDRFLRKSVTQRKIESSSSGGRSGGHRSGGGGGGHHGGGGHSR
ncbi:MAG: TPM domain-containing protein [Lachnospiraceae bacterium]|nr:TPM domain-containing protein [Lachnospiraceae bacterium]